MQAWLLVQAVPQVPQLVALLMVSTHEPLQLVSPAEQPTAQAPALQT
jgi:hypothetical protein